MKTRKLKIKTTTGKEVFMNSYCARRRESGPYSLSFTEPLQQRDELEYHCEGLSIQNCLFNPKNHSLVPLPRMFPLTVGKYRLERWLGG